MKPFRGAGLALALSGCMIVPNPHYGEPGWQDRPMTRYDAWSASHQPTFELLQPPVHRVWVAGASRPQ